MGSDAVPLSVTELAQIAERNRQESPVPESPPEPIPTPNEEAMAFALELAWRAINACDDRTNEITITMTTAAVVGREMPITAQFNNWRPGPRVVSITIGPLQPLHIPIQWLPISWSPSSRREES